MDTWDRKFYYASVPRTPTCDYDLYSFGPNGVDDEGTRDDIRTCGSTPELRF